MTSGPQSYLALTVGPFRLALAADRVLAVLESVDFAALPAVRGVHLPGCDWGPLFGLGARRLAPLAVAIEAGHTGAIVGVDAADHLGSTPSLLAAAVPSFGLCRPELFAGALRDRRGVLLLLSPQAVVEFTAKNQRAV